MSTPATKSARTRAASAGDRDAANRLRSRRPAEKTVILADDDSLVEDLDAAIQADKAARAFGDDAGKATAAEALEKARTAVAADAITIVLRSIGRTRFSVLGAEHPAGDVENQELQLLTGNPSAKARWAKSFAPELVAACMREAGEDIKATDLTDMQDSGQISDGEMTTLFNAAHELHEGSRVADLGK